MARIPWSEWQRRRVYAAVIAAELIFLVTVVGSILLLPEGLYCDQGLSVFGTRDASSSLFVTGFSLSAFCLLLAAHALAKSPGARVPSLLLALISLLLLGVVLTPFTMSPFVGRLHLQIGTTLFATEFILATWLVVQRRPPLLNWIYLTFLPIGALAATTPLCKGMGLSIYGQILFQVSFSLLLIVSFDWVFRRQSER